MTVRLLALVCAFGFTSLVVPQTTVHRSFPALLYTATPVYQPLAWLQGGERFPQGATVFVKRGAASKPLAPEFFATADANVSFDGKSVLFSGKQHAKDRWQIWELTLSTGTLHQVTHCDDDCIKPFYVPADSLVYAHKSSGRFVLEIAPLDGRGSALPLTHAPGNFLPSDVLHDGRILFASGYPLESSVVAELYTVYPDGSGVEAYRCDHGRSRHSGRQVSSGDIVFARGGKLFRLTSALAHEVEVPAPHADYAGDVAETPTGSWIVSTRSNQNHFELTTWKPGTAALLPLISDPKMNIIEPVVLAARTVPNIFPSALHEWPYANVLCLNAYTSKEHIARGSIAAVRLYTRDALGQTQVQGTAQVEKDGSFYLRVPGDHAIRIELLDASGKSVKSEVGWYWLRSGEQRICVGCHAGPERAPENAIPAVLQRSTEPADFSQAVHASAAGGH